MKIKLYLSLFKRKSFSVIAATALGLWLVLIAEDLMLNRHTSLSHAHELHSHHVHQLSHHAINFYDVINLHWFLMIIVMMFPLLFLAVEDVIKRSFKRKRAISLAFFFLGYMLLWTCVGSLLFIATHYLNLIFANHLFVLVIMVFLLWQITPYKKMCLNRCQTPSYIRPFGVYAIRDSFIFGLKKGCYCVGTCWPLMWLCIIWMQPMMYVMPLFTILLLYEQLTPRRAEVWGF